MTDQKLHIPLLKAVVEALDSIFIQGYYADKVIERGLKDKKLRMGSRDRRFFAESVYEVVRWWRPLWTVAQGAWHSSSSAPSSSSSFPSLENRLDQSSLEQAILWKVVGAWLVIFKDHQKLPNWPEFTGLEPGALKLKWNSLDEETKSSFPDWINERAHQELGHERWPRLREALNLMAPVFLRVNTLKNTPPELQSSLSEAGVEANLVEGGAWALRLTERKPIFKTEAFHQGLFEVQDLSSQQVAPFLDPEPGQRVIDACAGAGGKSLHLAMLMKNKGRIIAMDIHEHKLKSLRQRARRAGADIIETREIESKKVIKRLRGQADRLLLDVPCSGLGVVRRNPDSKWKLKAQDLDHVLALQAEILRDYSSMVKPGGKMVYATCSVLPSENEQQVRKFLNENESLWELEEEIHFEPSPRWSGDGFYAARLKMKRES